jgi:hypothetical protein
MINTIKNKLKWFLQDDKGNYAIVSLPNLPLYIIIFSYIGMMVFRSGTLYHLFDATESGAIFLWSYLEIRNGKSPFRRVLGAVVLIVFLYNAAISAK